MSPNLKGLHYGCKFQIMDWIILLVRPELAGSIGNYFPVLLEYTTQSFMGRDASQ